MLDVYVDIDVDVDVDVDCIHRCRLRH